MLLAKKKPVVFAGENHLITLYYPNSDKRMISTSCWRCSYSEFGEGFVLCISIDNNADLGLPSELILTDNPSLAKMVARRFNQYFEGFGAGFATLEPQLAVFHQEARGQQQHLIRCHNAVLDLQLIWFNLFESALEIFHNTSGPIPYDVSAVICSCKQGQISINGNLVAGQVFLPDGPSASSAFLAFSETWVEIKQSE